MKNQPKLLSGFLDYMPERMSSREQIIEAVKSVYRSFGFVMQSSPNLERAELLLGNIGADEKLIYQFRDHGGRQLALRYDLTVPLKRITREHFEEIKLPFKRSQLGTAWRADSPGKGRFREFLQFDADILGDDSTFSDVEVLIVVATIMKSLGVPVTIRYNSREILDSLVTVARLTRSESREFFRVLDKYDKIGGEKIIQFVRDSNFRDESKTAILDYLHLIGDKFSASDLEALSDLFIQNGVKDCPGVNRLREISEILTETDFPSHNFAMDLSIARGLDYYTGLVFETKFLPDPTFGSVCSGGRYDRLVTAPNGEFLPTVGIGLGIDRLFVAMESAGILPAPDITADILIVNFGTNLVGRYVKFAELLRHFGYSVLVYPKPIRMSKQLQFANHVGAKSVVMIGYDEIVNSSVKLKCMSTGQEFLIPENLVVQKLHEILGGEENGES